VVGGGGRCISWGRVGSVPTASGSMGLKSTQKSPPGPLNHSSGPSRCAQAAQQGSSAIEDPGPHGQRAVRFAKRAARRADPTCPVRRAPRSQGLAIAMRCARGRLGCSSAAAPARLAQPDRRAAHAPAPGQVPATPIAHPAAGKVQELRGELWDGRLITFRTKARASGAWLSGICSTC
jgi:hypothetical protein